ncbi:class I SAM-dependent methyltransferase [Kribbella sp. NPDC055071]
MRNPVFARLYARLRPRMDEAGASEYRRRLLDGLSGQVVEVGAGDGGNFAHYPAAVTSVLAIEPEPYLRGKAQQQAESAPGGIVVVNSTADRLPLPDDSVDAVVMSLVLCSVPDQVVALTEARRVLRPGGELRFWEHVAAPPGAMETFQKLLDLTIWPPLAGGCHLHRDTATAITTAGFTIATIDRFSFPPSGPDPSRHHILGRAT